MRGITFAPRWNTGRKSDATGAFQPEARAFAEMHGGRVVLIDNRQPKARMRQQVLTELIKAGAYHGGDGGMICCGDDSHDHRLEFVAIACHGWGRGIQFGFDIGSAEALASEIARVSTPDVVVPLFCCSTADTLGWLKARGKGPGGDRGFADELRDALCREGATHCVVDAHVTVGHAFKNPHVRRFAGDGSPEGGIGGQYIVERGSSLWRPWVRALREDMRFRFPFMPIGMIHDELAQST